MNTTKTAEEIELEALASELFERELGWKREDFQSDPETQEMVKRHAALKARMPKPAPTAPRLVLPPPATTTAHLPPLAPTLPNLSNL